jgi:hypothetical protein
VAGDAPGPDHPAPVRGGVAAAEPPGADGNPPLRRQAGDLVFGSDNRDLGVERLGQGGRRDLGADTAGVAEGYRETRPLRT